MQTQGNAAMADDVSHALSALLVEAQKSLQRNPSTAERCIGRAVDILARAAKAKEAPAGLIPDSLPPWRMKRVRELVQNRLDEELTCGDLAQAAGLSPSRFGRAFKTSLGLSPHQYLMRARIERAKMLMLTSVDGLSDIALACGLADQSHFSRLFSRLENETPATWRRRQTLEGALR